MNPKQRRPRGELELAVLSVLWSLRSASTRQIHDQIAPRLNVAYTTTAKVLDRLAQKGLVARRRQGRSHIHQPRLDRALLEQRPRVRATLVRLLRPAPWPAMAELLEAVAELDPEIADELAHADPRAVRAAS